MPIATQLIHGIYRCADDPETTWNPNDITIAVKETEKSYIFTLIKDNTRYTDSHIDMLFSKSNRIAINKNRSPHTIRVFDDHSFTIYPYRNGVPFYFELLED